MLAPAPSRRSVKRRSVRRFHELLRDELEIRARKNPQYSLRAFARDLGIAPSRLSEIIRGRRGLSVRTIAKVSEKLGLSDTERTYHTLHAQLQLTKNLQKKKRLKQEIKELERRFNYHELATETHVPITWLHFGILEAIDLPGFEFKPEWVAKKFGLEVHHAAELLEEIESMGVLKFENGRVKRLSRLVKFVPAPGQDSVEARREDYSKLIERVKAAVLTERVGAFLSTSQYMALPESCLEEVRMMIQEFKEKVVSFYEKAEPGERVYCLNVNFLPLDQKAPEEQ